MSLDIPWFRYNQLVDYIFELTNASGFEAAAMADTIAMMILDVGEQALEEAIDHTDGVKLALIQNIDDRIADVMTFINEETELIYDQLELWLDDVEDWITFLVQDIVGSIEENVGFTEESIEGIGTVIGDNIGVGLEETGSWIGNVYDNVKATIFDTTSNLIERIAGLVDLIMDAPELIIAKMLTELIPAEAARWLLTAGSVLTGVDMGHWFGSLRSVIISASDDLLKFDKEEMITNFISSFKLMQSKMPELLK